jgi:two-component system, sensor histidine kinase RegB
VQLLQGQEQVTRRGEGRGEAMASSSRGVVSAKTATGSSATAITLAWLVRLRWGAALGQTSTIAVVTLALGFTLPILPLAVLVAANLVSNLALALWLRRAADVSPRTMGLVLGADTFFLSGLLYFTGGPANPFSVLYLVYVTLAAMVLGMRWAWVVVALSLLSYATLFVWHVPIAGMEHTHAGGSAYSVHLQGMWVALAVTAALISYFVARVAAALRAREAELVEAQRMTARTEKLASLSTLAAGAAHELGTPLATIAVATRELELSIARAPEDALGDARLIRTEVERCRGIVQRMSIQAGQSIGEVPERTTAAAVVHAWRERLGEAGTALVDVGVIAEGALVCPTVTLIQVLVSLTQNALYASREKGTRVRFFVTRSRGALGFTVEDEGAGISADNLARIGEPFFTTKPPGDGMGLGLFLGRAFAERLGGALVLTSTEGKGTRAVLELPVAPEGANVH